MSIKNNEKIKKCIKCNIEKSLQEGFYRAGSKENKKYCRPCHNKERLKWDIKYTYVKKGTGFSRLPEDIRANILKDIEDKLSYSKISKKYEIKYRTLLDWKGKNIIV